jgi:hypothetical protein
MYQFIKASKLKEELDFRIITYLSWNEDFDMHIVEDTGDQNALEGFVKTMFDKGKVIGFYGALRKLDTSLLSSLGLGAVEMLQGNYKAKKFLYNLDNSEDEFSMSDELIKMGIYFQLTDPDLDYKWLENLIGQEETFIRFLIISNQDKILKQLRGIFKSKKRGKVIIFPRKKRN